MGVVIGTAGAHQGGGELLGGDVLTADGHQHRLRLRAQQVPAHVQGLEVQGQPLTGSYQPGQHGGGRRPSQGCVLLQGAVFVLAAENAPAIEGDEVGVLAVRHGGDLIDLRQGGAGVLQDGGKQR